MSRLRRIVWGLVIVAGLLPGGGVLAQGGGDVAACPALVETVLAEVGAACGDLGRDEACYGHHRVDAEFWTARDDLAFSAAADVIPLADLRTIRTAPLDVAAGEWGVAVLNLQANLPDTLPGQAVRFLLLGDVTLENRVEPSAAEPVPVSAVAATGANLRSGPSTTANVVTSIGAGTDLTLIGVSLAGDWFQVRLDTGGEAWIYGELIGGADATALSALPVVDPANVAPDYGPMQAFYFTSGLADPACQTLPNGLLVENATGTQVALDINGLQMEIGSSILFQTIERNGNRYLRGVLLEGRVDFQLGVYRYRLEEPGTSFAITLDENGWVNLDSRLENLRSAAGVDWALREACQSAVRMASWWTGPLETIHQERVSGEDPWMDEICAADLYYLTPQDNHESLCWVTATQLANLRQGPGTTYPYAGTLDARHSMLGTGQAIGADNMLWWQVEQRAWIRGDMVTTAPGCELLPPVAAPTPVPEPTQDPNATSQPLPSIVYVTYCRYNQGGHFPNTIAADTPFIAMAAGAARTEDLAANSYNYFAMTLTVDGVSYGESASRRWDRTGDSGCPISVHGSWSIPGLAPGEHTISVGFTAIQHWPVCQLDRSEAEGANPGDAWWVDTCTVTVR